MSKVKRALERRLGAMMFTDVVGHSSRTEKDEKKALRLLEEHRKQLTTIFPKYDCVVVRSPETHSWSSSRARSRLSTARFKLRRR